MKRLIDKSAVVAEIENWKQHTLKCGYAGQGEYEEGNKQGRLDTCEKILSFLDTFETKEVDLDKEFEWFLDEVEGVPRMWHSDEQIEWAKDIAKHFYELGLAQKGE